MNQNKLRLAASVLAWVCIAVSAAVLPWLCWGRVEVRTITTSYFQDKGDVYMTNWLDLDRHIRYAAGDGNVAMRLIGFDPKRTKNLNVIQELYDRGSYALYPQRVLGSEEGTIVGGAKDLIATRFDPSPQWLADHNVRSIVQITETPGGEIQFQIVPVQTSGGR